MTEITALRVRAARKLIARVDATDITDPDLPRRTAVDLLVRLKMTVDLLADHAEAQQENLDRLEKEVREAQARVSSLEYAAAVAAEAAA
ncbi:hypothetical protein [Streptomyces sp. C1-2]|uniref:hypothetical protein n=1 Tax=Streptomyces sp. C1-2 TaxID=2720022 RepID=UPI0014327178|nr:hypothetical protein [Streptomyces sp. C1-2]NJP72520.1 hypothetical protein [Streptomyces sp. C1-2]